MNLETTRKKLEIVEKDRLLQNFIAQANARYILLNTSEDRANFPPYTIRDDKLELLALYYLNIGCSFAENQSYKEAIVPLEKGASILESIHAAKFNRKLTSNYYGLIASLSYYVSFQYSKAFILIKKIEKTSTISQLTSLFLIRDFDRLEEEINKLYIEPSYQDDFLSKNFEEIDGTSKVYEVTIAKALDLYLRYLRTGEIDSLVSAKDILKLLKDVAEIESDPGIWWVIRLLILIGGGFEEASLWNVLVKHFDITHTQVDKYIKSLVYQQPRGIYELFITQRDSLDSVLHNDNGSVVSIPTSSGKTRIAELAILHTLYTNPEDKVLYIAPFRSLAFEVENTLGSILSNSNISTSHLYGGSLYSKLDEKIIEDSDVIIATPEKAKAILRGNENLIENIKLVVIDEGHLLGAEKRLIVNEIFYEEIRYHMLKNNGKFLLLSAVLPNSDELAEWLTSSEDSVYKANWRPSDERLGIMQWDGNRVDLNWISSDVDRQSFNNRFIVAEELPMKPRQRKPKYFPSNKNEAIAAATYKLRSFGSALIFVGLKASVFTMAEAYFKCLGNAPEDHQWRNIDDWRAFELSCVETYGSIGNRWLAYAKKGILCHNADLHSDVRLPLERLMRSDKPLVIISTSTLGQGVNLGVSTVVFSTLYQAGSLINARDFWNIAGRAGRAFVDHEGKILVGLDTSNLRPTQLKYHSDLIRNFFDKEKIDLAHSGILSLISVLKDIAIENDLDFDLLIQLIAENKTNEISDDASDIDEALDWIDDTLLSLLSTHSIDEGINVSWIEDFFSKSLAFIQAKNEKNIDEEEVLQFFNSRVQGIIEKVGDDKQKWKSIIKSGIPLNSDLLLEEKLPVLIKILQDFIAEENTSIDRKIELLALIEETISILPVVIEDGDSIMSDNKDAIRIAWIKGESISKIIGYQNGIEIITKFYTFKFPWILNGIAKKMKNVELEDEAIIVEELSILAETGLPSLTKIKIYQAGIRSRVSANELGELFQDDFWEKSVNDYKRDLIMHKDYYKDLVSEVTSEWLELLNRTSRNKIIKIPNLSFTFGNVHERTDTLIPKSIHGKQYLISPDLKVHEDVTESDVDFNTVSNIAGIEFRYSDENEQWELLVNNPYVSLESD